MPNIQDTYPPKEKCKFVVRDGNCSKCPHLIKGSKKRADYIPSCFKESK